jgi:uncharacterized membrane protein YedE/YeeE
LGRRPVRRAGATVSKIVSTKKWCPLSWPIWRAVRRGCWPDGYIAVAVIPLNWARKNKQSLLGAPMQLPMKRELDARLIGGSLVFGIGWGIAGICPGPAVAILLTGHGKIIIFVLAMLAGMYFFSLLERRRTA